MKNQTSALLFILAFPIFSIAQSDSKNAVKVNLSSFVIKGIGLQYERKISKHFSAALGYSTIPKSSIAFQSTIEELVDDPNIKVGEFQSGTSVITPEIRYYVSRKGVFHGFYFAPYARISSYNMQVPIVLTANSKRVAFDGKLHNTTGGLMLGSNFQLSKRIYLDWWILGASIGSANGDLIAATSLNVVEQQELRNRLADIDVPFTKIQYTVNGNGATVSTTGTMVGIRGLGINLGVRF